MAYVTFEADAAEYRIRTGDSRVQLRVQGDEIILEHIGHRDRFHDERG